MPRLDLCLVALSKIIGDCALDQRDDSSEYALSTDMQSTFNSPNSEGEEAWLRRSLSFDPRSTMLLVVTGTPVQLYEVTM